MAKPPFNLYPLKALPRLVVASTVLVFLFSCDRDPGQEATQEPLPAALIWHKVNLGPYGLSLESPFSFAPVSLPLEEAYLAGMDGAPASFSYTAESAGFFVNTARYRSETAFSLEGGMEGAIADMVGGSGLEIRSREDNTLEKEGYRALVSRCRLTGSPMGEIEARLFLWQTGRSLHQLIALYSPSDEESRTIYERMLASVAWE